MRIWDIHPGYLNRQSLLGEHRELHGLVSIIVHRKKGYSRHPETLRWKGYGWAINQRHKQLACEMKLRGYKEKSPVRTRSNKDSWPPDYIDSPYIQFELLKEKYEKKDDGRIPLPDNIYELWSHHKYSVLARDQNKYKEIGRSVSGREVSFEHLALEMVEILRTPPSEGGMRNAVQHMWGYVSTVNSRADADIESWSVRKFLTLTQENVRKVNEPYLIKSTALSELMMWL